MAAIYHILSVRRNLLAYQGITGILGVSYSAQNLPEQVVTIPPCDDFCTLAGHASVIIGAADFQARSAPALFGSTTLNRDQQKNIFDNAETVVEYLTLLSVGVTQ